MTKFQLEVLEVHQVSTDARKIRDRPAVRVSAGEQRHPRADAAEAKAAHVENAAQEKAREDRHAFAVRAGDVAGLAVQLHDETRAERVIDAADEAVAQKLVVGTEVRRGKLGRPAQVKALVGNRRLSRVS